MDKIVLKNKEFGLFEYNKEEDFEDDVVANSKALFGTNSVYIDVKKKIGNSILSIPDGYLIDLTFTEHPQLYMIENELAVHDAFKHIGEQLLKFAISYKESGRKIKNFLLKEIENNNNNLKMIEDYISKHNYRNMDDFLEQIIFNNPVCAIIVIDRITDELDNVLKEIVMRTDILEFKKYLCGNEKLFQFTPFHGEILENDEKIDVDSIDTIIVPAREEGFERVFLGENSWSAIRISSAMIDRLKYIAAYQVAPISAITHIAVIDRIEKYEDTNKYIVYFKDKAKKINPIVLDDNCKNKAPQSPRYTIYSKLKNAKTLNDIF